MRMKTALCLAAVCLASIVVQAAIDPQTSSVQERTRGANRVVVARVTDSQSAYEVNQFGDQLIVSTVVLAVEETLKGGAADVLLLKLEGGQVGDVTLRVSDLPELKAGDRAVFFLDETPQGRFVPHARGLGILKLDTNNRVPGTGLTLAAIRSQARAVAP